MVSDNDWIFAAYKTIDIAVALKLAPCFTPSKPGEQRHGGGRRENL